MSLNFIDSMISQIKDIIELNIHVLFHRRQINIAEDEVSMSSMIFFSLGVEARCNC